MKTREDNPQGEPTPLDYQGREPSRPDRTVLDLLHFIVLWAMIVVASALALSTFIPTLDG